MKTLYELGVFTGKRRNLDKNDNGVEICFTEQDLIDRGYNQCLTELENVKLEIDREKVQKVQKLINNAQDCPYCENNCGYFGRQISEQRVEQEQCQWCYITHNSKFNLSKAIYEAFPVRKVVE